MNASYKPFILAYALFLVLGVVFLLSLTLLHSARLDANVAGALASLPYISACVSGALLGYVARTRVLAQLVLLGCCIAVGFGLLNLVHEIFIGPVDFSGLSGSGFVVVMSLPFVVLLCLVGGGLGIGLRRAMHA